MNTAQMVVNVLSACSCAAILVLCIVMLRVQTTLKCAPVHLGLGAIGLAAFLSLVRVAYGYQVDVFAMALQAGLAGCLAYLHLTPAQRAVWDGRTERRQRADGHFSDRFGRIE